MIPMRKLLILLVLLCLPIVTASADILGVEVPAGATSVDLTGKKAVSAKTLLANLKQYPSITTVDLTGVKVDPKEKRTLVQSRPDVTFLWTVELGGLTFSTGDTVMNLDATAQKIKPYDLSMALHALPTVEKVIMYGHPITVEDAEKYLFTQFPAVDFDWTMHWRICAGSEHDLRDDATAFTTAKGRQDPRLTAKQVWQRLQYLPDLLAIDVGHNNVSDLSFLTNYPNLRRLICIDSKKPVTDISPLAELMDLEYVELFMQGITDLTPLANHTRLLDLNLCHNKITDLTPLYSCVNLERLWISRNPGLTVEEIERFQQALPNCQVEYKEYQSTGAGWREHPRYFVMIKSFEDKTYYPFEE